MKVRLLFRKAVPGTVKTIIKGGWEKKIREK